MEKFSDKLLFCTPVKYPLSDNAQKLEKVDKPKNGRDKKSQKDKSQLHKKRKVSESSRSEQNGKSTKYETDQPTRPKTNTEEFYSTAALLVLRGYHAYFGRIFKEEELRLQNTSGTSEYTKLAILSYRCQALMHYKLFVMGQAELGKKCNIIAEFISKQGLGDSLRQSAYTTLHPADEPNQMSTNQSTPYSLSIPPPAGSNGSVGSQSSGYSSSTEHCLNQINIALPPPVPHVQMRTNVIDASIRQDVNLQYLFIYQNLWGRADNLILTGNNKEFFNALDHELTPLSPEKTFSEIAAYVREGIRRVKN